MEGGTEGGRRAGEKYLDEIGATWRGAAKQCSNEATEVDIPVFVCNDAGGREGWREGCREGGKEA